MFRWVSGSGGCEHYGENMEMELVCAVGMGWSDRYCDGGFSFRQLQFRIKANV